METLERSSRRPAAPIAGLYYGTETTQNTPLTGETTVAEDIDTELQAMKTLVETLEPLKPEVRTRVIEYAFKVLGIAATHSPALPISPTPPGQPAPSVPPLKPKIDGPTDILSLKEEKDPKTATQMIAVVAYYLAHLADERQDFITADDIQKYFVQGKYLMPGSKSSALINAKNAGYLDYLEPGKYRLNSVGYNLVAHKMPKDGSTPSKARRKSSKKKAFKKGKK
jgi:hypothetical protein